MLKIKGLLLGACVATAIAATGCGDEKTDITPAVKSFNTQFAAQGVELDCPDEVEGDTFKCDLKGTESGKSVELDMELTGDDNDTVDVQDQKAFEKALQEVAG